MTLIGEAVFARCLSALKEQRVAAAAALPGPVPDPALIKDKDAFVEHVRKVPFQAHGAWSFTKV